MRDNSLFAVPHNDSSHKKSTAHTKEHHGFHRANTEKQRDRSPDQPECSASKPTRHPRTSQNATSSCNLLSSRNCQPRSETTSSLLRSCSTKTSPIPTQSMTSAIARDTELDASSPPTFSSLAAASGSKQTTGRWSRQCTASGSTGAVVQPGQRRRPSLTMHASTHSSTVSRLFRGPASSTSRFPRRCTGLSGP
jgi:hypothetical protein